MMDTRQVESFANRIYLGDFGTAVRLKSGKRLSEKIGTRQYWSPEVYGKSYTEKRDCWAVGVIMYGLFSQKFPFASEHETRHKELQIHPRVCKEGKELILWALERDETKRCDAAAGAGHSFHERSTQEAADEKDIGLPVVDQWRIPDLEQSPRQATALEK